MQDSERAAALERQLRQAKAEMSRMATARALAQEACTELAADVLQVQVLCGEMEAAGPERCRMWHATHP